VNILRIFLILLTAQLATGCSPIYVARAAYEQFNIITSKNEIDDVLKDSNTTEEIKRKLSFIKQAKEFSNKIGLVQNDSYTSYVDIKRDEFSWIVMASEKTSFTMTGWWFPIIGTVPYKGFFDKQDALEYAKYLEEDNLESWVRPTDAYSTLGWFNDPVLSALLKRPIPDLVDTVLHEQLHSTYWFKDNVPYNETVANVVGLVGAIEFFEQSPDDIKNEFLPAAITNLSNAQKFSRFINELYDTLNKIYSDKTLTDQEKLDKRDRLFEEFIAPIKKLNPKMKNWDKVNNAQIMQSRTYFTQFEQIYDQYKSAGSLKNFITILGEQFNKCQDNDICPAKSNDEQ
jgi:predicted aminopeptidase